MNRAQKILIGIAVALGLMLAATVTWAGATVVRDGLVTITVHESGAGGTRLFIPIPGTAVRAVAHSMRWNGADRRHFRGEFDRVRPVLAALGDQLAACPDVRLVDVETDDQHVTVEKHGGSLRITVDDRGDHVQVSFPIDLAQDVLERLSA
jgi:hypothetical protein